MGNRKENKLRTRQVIIEETKQVLFQKGYIKLSTKDISSKSNVSQGTIFLHFQSKDNLLNYILIQLIEDFLEEFKAKCIANDKRNVFLINLIGVVSAHENTLSVIYKDYIHLSDDIKKAIDHAESSMKSLFFDNLRNTEGKEISIVDSFVLIDGFVSQIKAYLISKEFQSNTSVIKQSSGKLNKLYKYIFQ